MFRLYVLLGALLAVVASAVDLNCTRIVDSVCMVDDLDLSLVRQ